MCLRSVLGWREGGERRIVWNSFVRSGKGNHWNMVQWYNSRLLAASGYTSRNIPKLPAVAHIRGGGAAISWSRLPQSRAHTAVNLGWSGGT